MSLFHFSWESPQEGTRWATWKLWVWRPCLTLLTAAALTLLTTPDTHVGTLPSPATSPGCPEPAISWLKGKPRAFKRPHVPQWPLYTQGQAAQKPVLPLDGGQRTGSAAGRVQTQDSISREERGGASSLGPAWTEEQQTHKEGNAMRSGGGAHAGPARTPEKTTKNTAQPVLVSEPQSL